MDIEEALKNYDHDNINEESLTWCPGAQTQIDISQFSETELVFSKFYDTYCPIYFCNKHSECVDCEQHYKPKTLKDA